MCSLFPPPGAQRLSFHVRIFFGSFLQSKDAQDAIQKLTDKHAKVIDERVSAKEKDILKV